MNQFWGNFRTPTWLLIFPLLCLLAVATVSAAPTAKFSAVTSGSNYNLTLTANMQMADADYGRVGNYYLGFLHQGFWSFNNGPGWVPWSSGPLPVYMNELLSNRSIVIVRNVDVSYLPGGQLYVGYGLSESDMLTNGKFAMVYTVVADTTAPTVSSTIHLNGATNVAINTAIGATFSEEIAPATINTGTFRVRETVSGQAVPGTVSYTGVTAVFVPNMLLAPSTKYTVTVSGGANGVKDLAGIAMVNDFTINWTTGLTPETIPPTVSNTVNANGATNVAINTAIGATFSEGMDPLTVNTSTVSLMQGSNVVSGSVSYAGVTMKLVPSNLLANSTGYTVRIKGGAQGVKDLAGNAMVNDYVWSWTTANAPTPADTSPPTVIGTIHAHGATNVAINTAVGATFSEGMDPLSITNVTFSLKETISGTPVAGTVSYSGVNAVFTPLANLALSTSYTVTIKGGNSGVKDLANNALVNDYVISWTTSASADIVPPTVTGTINLNAALNVAINTQVGATFSEGMDPLSITNVNFTLKETISGNAVTGTVSYAGLDALFVPTGNLAKTMQYTATIKGGVGGAKDLAGNVLVSDYVWSWTTAGAGPVAVNLGTAGNYVILTKTQITNVPTSAITGNVAASPINGAAIGLTCSEVTGIISAVDASGPAPCSIVDPANLTPAIGAMETAYTDAAGRPSGVGPFLNIGAGTVSNKTLVPGTYTWGSDVTIPTNLTFAGDANDVWIIQISGKLDLAANKLLVLTGGAKAKNIYWQVAGVATLGVGSHFEGVILAATNIALLTGASVNGRLLAQTAVTLQQNTVTQPAP